MSERDLIQELKSTIKDLSDEKEDLLKTIKQKESRIKTVMIKLEHATDDVKSVGHKVAEKDKEITNIRITRPMTAEWFAENIFSHSVKGISSSISVSSNCFCSDPSIISTYVL